MLVSRTPESQGETMTVLCRAAALIATALTLPALTLSTGCAAPQYEYVKSSAHKTYFKVPTTWHQIDQDRLDSWISGDPDSATAKARQQLIWTVAYDGSANPTVTHIFGFGMTPQPVAWAKVETLPQPLRGSVSMDSLRDMVLPVTPDARKAVDAQVLELEDFELLVDDVVTPEPGLHGVHEVFSYRLGTVLHTFDQTVLVNDDASQVYLFLVRCTAACFTERKDEISTVVSSFTVRSK
jgi:hypothetical protein